MHSAISTLTEIRGVIATDSPYIRAIDAALELGLEPLAAAVLETVRGAAPSEVDGLTAAKRVLLREAATQTVAHVAELRVTMDEQSISGRAIDRLRIERCDRLALVRDPKEMTILCPLPRSVGLASLVGYRWESDVALFVQSYARQSDERRRSLLADAFAIDAKAAKR
jgi:hypothetical protein